MTPTDKFHKLIQRACDQIKNGFNEGARLLLVHAVRLSEQAGDVECVAPQAVVERISSLAVAMARSPKERGIDDQAANIKNDFNVLFTYATGTHLDGDKAGALGATAPGAYQADAYLGWRGVPHFNGVLDGVKIVFNRRGWRIDDGWNRSSGKTGIHVYGCSYVFGWGVDSADTISGHLQRLRPDGRIENYGHAAYGTAQNYLTLIENLAFGKKPDVVIFCFIGFHLGRNVGLYIPSDFSRPVAGLTADGQLKLHRATAPVPELYRFDVDHRIDRTYRLIMAAHRACVRSQTNFIFAVLRKEEGHGGEIISGTYPKNGQWTAVDEARLRRLRMATPRLTARLRKAGLTVVDLSPPSWTPDYWLSRSDSHPNAATHKAFAVKLNDALEADGNN